MPTCRGCRFYEGDERSGYCVREKFESPDGYDSEFEDDEWPVVKAGEPCRFDAGMLEAAKRG